MKFKHKKYPKESAKVEILRANGHFQPYGLNIYNIKHTKESIQLNPTKVVRSTLKSLALDIQILKFSFSTN